MNFALLNGLIMNPLASACAYGIAGCAYYAYVVLEDRDPLLRRVDAITPANAMPRTMWLRAKERARSLNWASHVLTAAERYELVRRMARFGIEEYLGILLFVLLRVTATAGLGFAGLAIAGHLNAASLLYRVAGLFAGLAIGWIGPSLAVHMMVKRRQQNIAQGLPDALELLVVCTEAGLALEAALDRVARELRHGQPAIAEELATTSAELKVLPEADVALGNLARRVDIGAIRTVITCISQTLRYGTPLAQALRVTASALRSNSLVRLEEQAGRLPVLLNLPMMLLIFPTIFMIVAGPSVLHAIDTFR